MIICIRENIIGSVIWGKIAKGNWWDCNVESVSFYYVNLFSLFVCLGFFWFFCFCFFCQFVVYKGLINILKKMTFWAKRGHCEPNFRYVMGMQDSVLLILLQCVVFFCFHIFLCGWILGLVLWQMYQMVCSSCNVRSKDQDFKSI